MWTSTYPDEKIYTDASVVMLAWDVLTVALCKDRGINLNDDDTDAIADEVVKLHKLNPADAVAVLTASGFKFKESFAQDERLTEHITAGTRVIIVEPLEDSLLGRHGVVMRYVREPYNWAVVQLDAQYKGQTDVFVHPSMLRLEIRD